MPHFGADCPRIGRVRAIPFLLALILFVLPCLAQQTAKTYRVPFHNVNGMILLDATLDGKVSKLLLDTGANAVIVDAKALGLSAKLQEHAISGGSVGVKGESLVAHTDLRLGERLWSQRQVAVMDLTNTSKVVGTHIDGLIGEDLLNEFSAVRIDYRNHVVELETK